MRQTKAMRLQDELDGLQSDIDDVKANIQTYTDNIKAHPRALMLTRVSENRDNEKLLLRRLQYRQNRLRYQLTQVAA